MDVLEVPDEHENEKSQSRQDRDWMHELHGSDMEQLERVVVTLKRIDSFSKTKKNMSLLIRDGIRDVLRTLQMLKNGMES